MPIADWIRTPEFESGISQRLQATVESAGLRSYELTIPRLLLELAELNLPKNQQLERERREFSFYTAREGLSGASNLSRDGADIARAARSPQLLLSHVVLAYARKFCSYWPFC